MSEKILRTALIGAGGIGGGFHLRNISSNEKYELCAIVDVNEETLAKHRARYNVPTYTSMAEMLKEVKPELCVIATPTPLHVTQTIECMAAGCDVFLEKPMGMSLEEAQKLPEACEKYGKKLMIYQPHRARSETLCALDIIKSGKLGDIYMIKREFSYYYLRDHWQGYKKNGGGNLSNHGAHYIDQLLYLSGGSPAKAFSVLKPIITTGDADDCAKAVIVTDNNVTLDLDINFVSAQNVNSMKIYGKYGEAELIVDADNKMTFRLKYYDPAEHDGDRKVFPFKEETVDVSEWAPIDFYDKCHEYYALDCEPFVKIEDTLKVMAAIDMCREASGEY